MMKRHRVLLTALLMASSLAFASESYKPPEGGAWQMERLYREATGPFDDATGVVAFACNMAETQHRVQSYIEGVRANSTYTLWLVDMEGSRVAKTHEITSRWRDLRSDRRGVISNISNLPWCPVGWDVYVVKYHPDGDPDGWSDGITVLKGYLKEMTDGNSGSGG